MDRQTFLKLAPEYYMLALYIHLQYPADYYTDISWQKDFSYNDDGALENYCYVENVALRQEAIRLMRKHKAITVIEDPFGPTIWQKTESIDTFANELEKSQTSVFFRARASGDPKAWLYAALSKLNFTADELSITSDDFSADAVAESLPQTFDQPTGSKADLVDEWEPIKIDQADPVLVEATKQLDAVTEAVEQDNGYSIKYPQERDAVVADLKGGLEKLKSGVVSTGWLRRTIVALKQVSFRFAGTVKGQAVDGALSAIKDVVKSHVGHALEYLWSLLQ